MEKLILNAQKLFPELTQVNKTLAGLYLDKGELNTKIGNYSGAIQNYKDAIQLYPAIESLVLDKLNKLTNLFMKDAYFAAKDDELFLVVNSLRSIIELNPELANELDSYLIKLELQLENQRSKVKTNMLRIILFKERRKQFLIFHKFCS